MHVSTDRPVTSRKRPKREDVRARVLDAARGVFADVGYHRASLNTIASQAGFSKGAVYSNFASKEELFLALLGEQLTQRADRLTAATRRARTVDGEIKALARALVTMVTEEWNENVLFAEFRTYAARDRRSAEILGRIRGLLTDAVADRLAEEARTRGLRLTMPPRHAATVFLALVNGLSLEQIGRTGSVVSPASVAVVLRSLFTGTPPSREVGHVDG